MKNQSFSLMLPLLLALTLLSSCDAIGTIFKAGVWTAVIGIGLVVFIILYFVNRSRK